jgi:hypothetical protein
VFERRRSDFGRGNSGVRHSSQNSTRLASGSTGAQAANVLRKIALILENLIHSGMLLHAEAGDESR